MGDEEVIPRAGTGALPLIMLEVHALQIMAVGSPFG
jgi:hypothetical protein